MLRRRLAWPVAPRHRTGAGLRTVVRLSLKELLAQLDGRQFVQVHRAVVVNLAAIQRVTRGDNETAEIAL